MEILCKRLAQTLNEIFVRCVIRDVLIYETYATLMKIQALDKCIMSKIKGKFLTLRKILGKGRFCSGFGKFGIFLGGKN